MVRDLGSRLGARDAALVTDFIEHNEFGVAFEWLRDVLIENAIAVPSQIVDELAELARLMDLDAQEPALRSQALP